MNSNMEKGDMVIKAHWEGTGSNTRLYLAVEGVPDILQKMFFGMMQGLGVVPTQIEGLEEPQCMDLSHEREETIALITEADMKDVEDTLRQMEQKESKESVQESQKENAKDLNDSKQEMEKKPVVSNNVQDNKAVGKEPVKAEVTNQKKEEPKAEVVNTHIQEVPASGKDETVSKGSQAQIGTGNDAPAAQTPEDNKAPEMNKVQTSENKTYAKPQENVSQQNGNNGRQYQNGNTEKQNYENNNSNNTSNQRNSGNGNNYRGNYGKNNNFGKYNNSSSQSSPQNNSKKNDNGQQSYQKSGQDANNGYKNRADQLGPQLGSHKITDGEYKGMTAEEVVNKHRLNAVVHFHQERNQRYYGGVMKKEIKAAVQKYIDTITDAGSMGKPDKAIQWLTQNYSEATGQELKKLHYGNTYEDHVRFLNTESVEVKAAMAKTLFQRLVKEI